MNGNFFGNPTFPTNNNNSSFIDSPPGNMNYTENSLPIPDD